MRQSLRKMVPNKVKKKLILSFYKLHRYKPISSFFYTLKLKTLGFDRKSILILATITKTGTHYTRYLLSYYLFFLENKNKVLSVDSLEPSLDIVDKYLPNGWNNTYQFKKKFISPTYMLKEIGLNDIPRSHLELKGYEWRNSMVLHTYRHVLDQVVVSWVSKYRVDPRLKKLYNHPIDLLKDTVSDFATQYHSFNNPKKRKYVNTLSFDFYFIFNYPKRYLKLILEWLGCEFDNEVATAAITITNKIGCIKVGAGEKWQRSDVKGYDYSEFYHFINKYESTGAINCHVDYFDSDQMAEAIDICKKHGLINDKN